MNKQKAIGILNRQIEKLDKKNPKDFNIEWKVQTCSYIDKFFGGITHESKRINSAPSNSQYSPDLIPFLNDCIETIQDVGIYKKPKTNFLYSMPRNWVAMLSFPLIFTIGLALGNIEKKNQLNDSANKTEINSSTPFVPDGISNPNANTIHEYGTKQNNSHNSVN